MTNLWVVYYSLWLIAEASELLDNYLSMEPAAEEVDMAESAGSPYTAVDFQTMNKKIICP